MNSHKSKYLILLLGMLLSLSSFSQNKGINFQAVVKSPSGQYPTASGVSVTIQIMDPINDCVLREEVHSGIQIANGFLNLVIGASSASTPLGINPSPVLSLREAFDNATARNNLNCVDPNNNIVANNQTYTPSSSHSRKLRVRFFISSDEIVADFNMRSVPFAVNTETLDGKSSNQFIQTSSNITQSKTEALLTDPLYSNLLNLNSNNSGAYILPTGTTLQQPSSPVVGMMRFNTTLNQLEIYNGSWSPIVSGGGAGSTYQASDGTAAAPGITFNSTGNTDTGLYLPATDTLAITTGGTEKMRISSSGNVGIGTNNPLHTLDVQQSGTAIYTSTSSSAVVPSSETGGASAIRIYNTTNTTGTGAYLNFSSTRADSTAQLAYLGVVSNNNSTYTPNFVFGQRTGISNYTERLRIDHNGNMGFGTDTPVAKLDIRDNVDSQLSMYLWNAHTAGTSSASAILVGQGASGNYGLFRHTGDSFSNGSSLMSSQTLISGADTNGLLLAAETGPIRFAAGNTNYNTKMILDATGKLGIGGNPSNLLTVSGNADFTGSVGIGVSAPTTGTKLKVAGQIATSSSTDTDGSIDFSLGNSISTSFDCGSNVSFSNLNDGGSYTLVITGTGTSTCNFSTSVTGDGAATVTYRFRPANAARTSSSHTIYSLMRVGNIVYVSWDSGF